MNSFVPRMIGIALTLAVVAPICAGDVAAELKQTLDNANDQQRILTMRKFKATGADAIKVAEVLIPYLSDKTPVVQDAAQFAISQLGPGVAPTVVPLLKSTNQAARNRASQVLGNLGPTVTPLVLPYLKDDDASIRIATLNVLLRHRQPELVVPISEYLSDSNLVVRRMAAMYVSGTEKNALPALPKVIPLLGETDPNLRKHALAILRNLGPDAVPELVKAVTTGSLKDAPPETQALAVNIAATSGKFPKEAIPMLLERSRSDFFPLRVAAMNALAKLLPDTAPKMRELLADPRPDVRQAAMNALQMAGPEAVAVLPEIVGAMKTGDVNAQNMAAATIMRMGAAAVPDLVKMTREPKTRERATQILENLSGPPATLVPALAEVGRREPAAVRALRRHGLAAQPALVELVNSTNPEVKAAALDTLAKLGPVLTQDKLPPDLNKYLKDPNVDVRVAAVRLFVKSLPPPPKINDKEFIDPLLAALNDPDWDIRRAAVQTLARIPYDSTGKLVELMRKSPSAVVRDEAIVALATLGPRARAATKPLVEIVRDPGELRLRKRALWALPKIEPVSSPIFVELLNDRDSGVRADTVGSLKAEHVELVRTAIVKLLGDKSEDVRAAAVKAIGTMSPFVARDVEPLMASDDAEVRAAAIQAAGKYVAPAALKKHLGDDKTFVRAAAAAALAKHGPAAFPFLEEALRSKTFRAERAACDALVQMEERPDELIAVLIETMLATETEEPESMARAVLRINPILGARQLAALAKVSDLVALLKKDQPEFHELACLALVEHGKAATPESIEAVTALVKNEQTPPSVLAAAARALFAANGTKATPELAARIVRGIHEKSMAMRDQALADVPAADLGADSAEAILVMLALNQSIGEASEWTILHATSGSTTGPAAPTFLRILALSSGRDKRFAGRLTPQAQQSLKEHFWRYAREGAAIRRSIEVRPLPDVRAPLQIDYLVWAGTAYLALDLVKDDPAFKDQKVVGLTPKQHFDEWTEWWRDWARHRAIAGFVPETGTESLQPLVWPCLLNMADYATDPVVKQRFKMLIDLAMIDDEQMCVQGVRGGQRGKKTGSVAAIEPIKDVLVGRTVRPSEASAATRAIAWTTSYQLPPAAIMLRFLDRPTPDYAVANRQFPGARQFGFVTPHIAMGCEIVHPQQMEQPGYWRRLVFDDGNLIAFPLTTPQRRHLQHRNAYVATFFGGEHPAVELTGGLKVVESKNWLFVTNGPAHVALYFQGGYRLDKADVKRDGRRGMHVAVPVNPHSTILLHASDSTTGSFDEFQAQILKAPLVANDLILHYTGPNLPKIDFFRDTKIPMVGGVPPHMARPDAKIFDSPYLQCNAGEAVVTVRFGTYAAIYDFENSRVTEK